MKERNWVAVVSVMATLLVVLLLLGLTLWTRWIGEQLGSH